MTRKASLPERILLNCDLGESFGAWQMGEDQAILPLVDCASIACGFHAGDPQVMLETVARAKAAGVRLGAHPAYPDLQGFGRRSMALQPAEVTAVVLYQLGALSGMCQAQGTQLSYVKPHGALYHDMRRDPQIFQAVMQAVHDFDASLPVIVLAQPDMQPYRDLADQWGILLWYEAFADRAYTPAGQLAPRTEPHAVHEDATTIVAQARDLITQQQVTVAGGQRLKLPVHTLCVHGDTTAALAAVRQIRQLLSAGDRL